MLNVYRHYDDFRTPSFRADTGMLCGNKGTQQYDTKRRICYLDDVLPFSSPWQPILR